MSQLDTKEPLSSHLEDSEAAIAQLQDEQVRPQMDPKIIKRALLKVSIIIDHKTHRLGTLGCR